MKIFTQEPIILGSTCGGLGDNLMLTPVCKKYSNVVIELLDHPKAKRVAPIFDGLAEVVYKDEPIKCIEFGHPHNAQKKLNGLGITDVNCIPEIAITDDEKWTTWENIMCIEPNKPLLAFSAETNGTSNPNDREAHYRMFDKWNEVLEYYSKRYIILHFANSDNYVDFSPFTTPVYDSSYREMAAMFQCIGRYLGIDSGPHHLALAVGAKATVLVPPDTHFYQSSQWRYTQELWKNEKPRVKYIPFQNYKDVLLEENLNFNY